MAKPVNKVPTLYFSKKRSHYNYWKYQKQEANKY